ncbi:MAG: GHKL domain-containing protein [Thaumarchaeota archaeon]|nr:GHKL domain-containing protein [Nitrososphaerota archaeon]
MEIAKKLILGAMVISFLSAIIIGISIYELEVSNDNQKKIAQIHRPALNTVIQMKTSMLNSTQETYAYILLNDPDEKMGFYSAMNTFDDMIKQYDIIKNYTLNPKEEQTFEEIKTLKNNFVNHAETIFTNYEKNGNVDSESIKLFEDSGNSIVLKVDELMNYERKELESIRNDSLSNTTSSVHIITILGSVIVGSIIVFSVVFSRKFTRSIEEKIQLEKKLSESNAKIRNERFVAIGELSSRLAHDIRNPLSVIKLNASMLKLSLHDQDEKNIKLFTNISRAVDQISQQIEDIMNFVRSKPLHLDWCSLSEILEFAINGINKPELVTIELKNPDQNVKIKCDAKKIEVLFSNLITNAVQAVEKQGKITITAKEQGEFVIVEVEDTGAGISKENIQHIFEPLFTTKQTGTGLGLASVKNIVEQHSGQISVRNNPTTFEVRLPKEAKS